MLPLKGLEIPNSLRKLEYGVPFKRDNKMTPWCMSSNKFFLKDGLQNNHRVGDSVMKKVYAIVFQKIKAMS